MWSSLLTKYAVVIVTIVRYCLIVEAAIGIIVVVIATAAAVETRAAEETSKLSGKKLVYKV